MILLLGIGYALVYAVMLMAFLAAVVAVWISFGVYLLTYVVMYVYAWVRNRRNPEWAFNTTVKRPQVNLDDLHQIALYAGIMSLVAMVVGFFAFAFSNRSWEVTWTAVTVVGVIAVVSYFQGMADEHTKDGSSP